MFGIDIGMTCSGIAYINRTKGPNKIQTFSNWGQPGREYKIPTRLRYSQPDLRGQTRLMSWGFDAAFNTHGEDSCVVEWFKEKFGDQGQQDAELFATRRYYTDYLRALYKQLQAYFSEEHLGGKTWTSAKINFYFSIPAKWTPSTVQQFQAIIQQSGFKEGPEFHVIVKLTEPHAVAAYTIVEEAKIIKKDDSVLIVDAGGGTVDLCFVTVDDPAKGKVRMTEETAAQGQNCGAAMIDQDFQSIIKTSLEELHDGGLLLHSIDDTAKIMRTSPEFQGYKESFGNVEREHDEIFRLPVPNPKKLDVAEFQLRGGTIPFNWHQLEQCFNKQVEAIERCIFDTLQTRTWNQGSSKNLEVNHIILSGGLGSSKYVQKRIRKYIGKASDEVQKGARNKPLALLKTTQLHVSGEPQLSVCHGLLIHASQDLSSTTMFKGLRSRLSIGVQCQRSYKKVKSEGKQSYELRQLAQQKGKIIEMDGDRWIQDCVRWFVKRETKVPEDRMLWWDYSVVFSKDIPSSERTAKVKIVTSQESTPPYFSDQSSVSPHTTIELDLSKVQPVKEGWFAKAFSKDRHVQVAFRIRATLEITTVSFQCHDVTTDDKIGKSVQVGSVYEDYYEPVIKPRVEMDIMEGIR